jgi:nicotinate phosphoribosyltransferase
MAARAAHVGGCSATSNVLAGMRFGIPVQGTHAHSWVMAFDTEREAFETYADAFPGGSVFLVDTYDTLAGVKLATEVGGRLRDAGHEMVGIRLDSGEMASLSIGARKILDDAGFPDAAIVASNDLDEHAITALKERGAVIDVWGVGTRMATAHDQPSLDAVYKLGAVREEPGAEWEPRMKVSSTPAKRSIPGRLRVRRLRDAGGAWLADAIYDDELDLDLADPLVHPESMVELPVAEDAEGEELLVPAMEAGARLGEPTPLAEARRRAIAAVDAMPAALRARSTDDRHFIGIDGRLSALREKTTVELSR